MSSPAKKVGKARPVSQDMRPCQSIGVKRKLRAGEPRWGLNVQEAESKRQSKKGLARGAGKPSAASVILDITVTYGGSHGVNERGDIVGLPAFKNECRTARAFSWVRARMRGAL